MLVLTRHANQSIVIGHDVIVTVLEVRGDHVRLGITAPQHVQVHREEVFVALEAANRRAASTSDDLATLRELDHNGEMTPLSPEPLEVDLDAFAAAWKMGAPVLDVRSAEEFAEAHVPGATLIPLPELEHRLSEVPRADPLYVICAAGGRSLSATRALVDAGVPAVSVSGGTNGWIARGGEVEAG